MPEPTNKHMDFDYDDCGVMGEQGSFIASVFDEREMNNAVIFDTSKENCSVSSPNKRCEHNSLVGIPIVLIAGDDFQLPPIILSAFYAFPGNALSTRRD
jgi:hypothetical protein